MVLIKLFQSILLYVFEVVYFALSIFYSFHISLHKIYVIVVLLFVGGEFDFESARQMYGLGKLVKKVTRTVKKIAKSPIGKAALLYTATGGLGNLASGQSFFSNFLSPTQFLGNTGSIFSKEGLKNIADAFEKRALEIYNLN